MSTMALPWYSSGRELIQYQHEYADLAYVRGSATMFNPGKGVQTNYFDAAAARAIIISRPIRHRYHRGIKHYI